MNQLATETFCLLMRNGTEFWMNDAEAKKLSRDLLDPGCPQFIPIRGRPVNKFEIVSIYSAKEIADIKHRKQGDWQCEKLNWHVKDEPCDCWQYGQ